MEKKKSVVFRDEQYRSPSILMAKVKAVDIMQKNIKVLSLLKTNDSSYFSISNIWHTLYETSSFPLVQNILSFQHRKHLSVSRYTKCLAFSAYKTVKLFFPTKHHVISLYKTSSNFSVQNM